MLFAQTSLSHRRLSLHVPFYSILADWQGRTTKRIMNLDNDTENESDDNADDEDAVRHKRQQGHDKLLRAMIN